MGDLGVGTETINALVKEIDDGKLILPEIQRGYVWNRSQVRDLLDSLYRSYPIGAILVWQTDIPAPGHAVGSETLSKAPARPTFCSTGSSVSRRFFGSPEATLTSASTSTPNRSPWPMLRRRSSHNSGFQSPASSKRERWQFG